ncbi:MAG: 4-alpha-glucanotransferase [Desulfobulbaceae bacterium A2]|nr:MAG: 4-alpha-glucanotransferase [Desulfobulbaceae bacterium A2]
MLAKHTHSHQGVKSQERTCGILLHLTSLPGRHGCGDLGAGADRCLDFLARAGQRYWQILPINPTSAHFDNSPYMSCSSMAGNPLLVSPETLTTQGLLNHQDLNPPPFSDFLVEFPQVIAYRRALLERACVAFLAAGGGAELARQSDELDWIEDYALFMALKEKYQEKPWYEWPAALARRDATALAGERKTLGPRLDYFRFEQAMFFRQWRDFRQRLARRGIKLIGDLPIYVSQDSVDVWANQDIFQLDRRSRRPTMVAGVPPDYFSATGQRWGNPLYRWHQGGPEVERALLDWWTRRFAAAFSLVDLIRVDHFRAFAAYWAIPARETTAVRGTWQPGPGEPFFRQLTERLGDLPLIIEDLGLITPDVERLRDGLGLPGMKVLQFAFDGDPDNVYLPHNFRSPDCVVYTGTHDNETTVGWQLNPQVSEAAKHQLRTYVNRQGVEPGQAHENMIHLALASTARLAILPMQDLLGFGNDCRMNTPSTQQGNWRWRCHERYFTPELADSLAQRCRLFGRYPRTIIDPMGLGAKP